MNDLVDMYNFIEELEKRIGDECKAKLFRPFDDAIAIQIDYPNGFRYRRTFSLLESRYIKNTRSFKDWLVDAVKREYRLVTVGEE